MAMTKVKNLQLWCKKMCEGYRDVEVRDMSSSWKSGLAFCAIIHRFRPDLIDYDSLSKENVFDNNNLAFEVAEKELNIPAFLEAADMVAIRVPDKLSVVTYVSQYYNYFHNKPQLGGPGVNKASAQGKSMKRTQDSLKTDQKKLGPTQLNTGETPIKRDRQESIGDKCTMCHEKVYLLERQIDQGKLYHRSCFRNSELSPTNKVFKRPTVSTVEEEKKGQSQIKSRKLDNGSGLEKKPEPEPDFWQRRAQQKAKEARAKSPVRSVVQDVPSNKQSNDLTPSWKQMTETKLADDKTSMFDKKDPSVHSGGFLSQTKVEESKKPATSNLASKFKELNDRNLQQTYEVNKSGAKDQRTEENKGAKPAAGSDLGRTYNLENNQPKAEKSGGFSPRAKPRQNIVQIEKMDTSEAGVVQPKAAPRQTKQETKSVSPRNLRKNEPRPKTPPFKHKSDFSLQNATSKGEKTISHTESPIKPPPLPSSTPPELPKQPPPKIEIQTRVTPRDQPVSTSNKTGQFANNTTKLKEPTIPQCPTSDALGPAKPPRVSQNMDSAHSTSPMEVEFTPSRAVIHDPTPEHKAVLVTPKVRHTFDDDKKDKEMLGGILKSLAGVKARQDGNNKASGAVSPRESNPTGNPGLNVSSHISKGEEPSKHFKNKLKKPDSKESLGAENRVKTKPPRPKSSFVSGTASLFSGGMENKTESHMSKFKDKPGRTEESSKPSAKTTDTKPAVDSQSKQDSVPEWKRQMDKQKERPKSADLLSDRKTDSVPEWQKEAEKRMAARKGGYVDPEKTKIEAGSKKPMIDITRPVSPPQRPTTDMSDRYVPEKKPWKSPETKEKHEHPVPVQRRSLPKPPTDNETPVKSNAPKKKITPNQKFTFNEEETNTIPKKPPRPLTSPTSPEIKSLSPPRPPPPQMQPSKHHISAFEIQRQLQMIDTKLTSLEIKGRRLEDSIRGAKEEEEDDLMISWFRLVNDKNELVRKEADLIYVSRAQELEEEQLSIDEELQVIASKPEDSLTKEEQGQIEFLIERKLDVINQRNNIVDSIDEDRLRYIEEDRDIEEMLKEKGFLKDLDSGKVVKKKEKKSKFL